jgi:hypothetical protein
MDLMVQGLKKKRAGDTVPVLTAPSWVAAIISSFTANQSARSLGRLALVPDGVSALAARLSKPRTRLFTPLRIVEIATTEVCRPVVFLNDNNRRFWRWRRIERGYVLFDVSNQCLPILLNSGPPRSRYDVVPKFLGSTQAVVNAS